MRPRSAGWPTRASAGYRGSSSPLRASPSVQFEASRCFAVPRGKFVQPLGCTVDEGLAARGAQPSLCVLAEHCDSGNAP